MRFRMDNVRLGFGAGLFEPYQDDTGKKGSFGCKLIFTKDHPQFKQLKDACIAVAREAWGDKYVETVKALLAQDRLPYHDGDLKAEWEGFPGNMYVSANSKIRPSVFGPDKSPVAESDGVVYSGCWGNASLEIWAQDNPGNKGGKRINAQLRGFQKSRDDDAFTGGGSAADESDFDEIAAPAEATSGADALLG